mmetsp:Transcript_982/g.3014  ORF Transcript_982/g.3014 Transcript_982/m.3014 type:complete len:224 (-) Transcript_982:2084-2755(-)
MHFHSLLFPITLESLNDEPKEVTAYKSLSSLPSESAQPLSRCEGSQGVQNRCSPALKASKRPGGMPALVKRIISGRHSPPASTSLDISATAKCKSHTNAQKEHKDTSHTNVQGNTRKAQSFVFGRSIFIISEADTEVHELADGQDGLLMPPSLNGFRWEGIDGQTQRRAACRGDKPAEAKDRDPTPRIQALSSKSRFGINQYCQPSSAVKWPARAGFRIFQVT